MEIFPQIDLFPRITRVAKAIGRVLTPYPQEAPDYMSNHYRGASEMLDHHLNYQPMLPFEPSDGEAIQIELVTDNTQELRRLIEQSKRAREGWTDMGEYLEREG
jgi:hypothetical protein